MRKSFPFLRLAAVPLILVLAHCQPKSVEDQVADLPELPPEVAATLDPNTLATKVVSGVGPPETTTGTLLVPCCSSTETRHLNVRFRYIKCGPLDDVVDLGQLVLSQERRGRAGPEMHRLTEFQGRKIPLALCRSSDGPWDAILIEKRGCGNPEPERTLVISAFGDVVLFAWKGAQSPPANVQVISCISEGTSEVRCGPSNCSCVADSCPNPAGCPCALGLPGPTS